MAKLKDKGRRSSYQEEVRKTFLPQNPRQNQFVQAMRDFEVSAAIGPAGVGKTYCAAGTAAQFLLRANVDGLILTRANVTVGKTIGYLPGTQKEKMEPLLLPIIDALKRHLPEGKVEYLINKSQIEMLPFEYVRGRSFRQKFVIIDEAQNLTIADLIAVITRYESGRVVLLGDPFQSDLQGSSQTIGINWLHDFCLRNHFKMPIIQFTTEDIVRSSFVKSFIEMLYQDRERVPCQSTVSSVLIN